MGGSLGGKVPTDQQDQARFAAVAQGIFVMVVTAAVLSTVALIGGIHSRREALHLSESRLCQKALSDLCSTQAASVRAADASEASVDVAVLQLGVGVFGLVGLAFTVVYAQRAWSAAARQAELARESIAAEHRPWLSLNCAPDSPLEPGRTHLGVDGFYMGIVARSRNHGRAPATNVSFHAELSLMGPETGGPEEILRRFMGDVRERGRGQGVTLFGEETTEDLGFTVFLPQPDIDASIAHSAALTPTLVHISPVIVGCLNYASDHTEGVRQTGFAALLSRVGPGGHAFVIDPTVPNWWTQKIAMNTAWTIVAS